MNSEDLVIELRNTIDLIRRDGTTVLDERSIPVLEAAINEVKEPCEDCIDREALMDIEYEDVIDVHGKQYVRLMEVADKTIKMPTVRPLSSTDDCEPCEDVAKERYEDLCEYFGDMKDILKSREEFKKWLERIKWHIRKAEELYEKYEYPKESCEDCISRKEALKAMDWGWKKGIYPSNKIAALPPVTPAKKLGKWIYGEDNLGGTGRDGWYCNQCGHFEFWDYSSDMESARCNLPNYCPNCETKMEVEE